MAIESQKTEARPPFQKAIEMVMEAYGYADWAVIARDVGGGKKSFWEAGVGGTENPVGDEERQGRLYTDMALLQSSLMRHIESRLYKRS